MSHVSDELTSPERLGRELRSARQSVGTSLRHVAGDAGISAAYLQKLERGQVDEPSPKILKRLASVLALEYRRLMELAGYGVPSSRPRQDPLSARFASADLTQAEEQAVAAFIDHLLAQRPPRS
jgi:transcriptional regulator with XRE-family HTH domain